MVTILAASPAKEDLAALSAIISREGHQAIAALDARSAASGLQKDPDLVVVDIVPGSQESALLWKLFSDARKTRKLPLLALLPEKEVEQYAPSLGADDFVLKPIRPADLSARLRRMLKSGRGPEAKETVRFGDLTIDLSNYEVALGGKRIELTYKEYELLKFLALNKGKVFNRDTLLNRIWGYDYYGGDRTVDVHVRRLRSKIEDGSHTFIETVRNVGYRFAPGG